MVFSGFSNLNMPELQLQFGFFWFGLVQFWSFFGSIDRTFKHQMPEVMNESRCTKAVEVWRVHSDARDLEENVWMHRNARVDKEYRLLHECCNGVMQMHKI